MSATISANIQLDTPLGIMGIASQLQKGTDAVLFVVDNKLHSALSLDDVLTGTHYLILSESSAGLKDGYIVLVGENGVLKSIFETWSFDVDKVKSWFFEVDKVKSWFDKNKFFRREHLVPTKLGSHIYIDYVKGRVDEL